MHELILHHYDFSPFSEKIRLIFGLKGLTWRSVIIPSIMPKPDLIPLTGGYRHTPVLQIGADIFCDTRLIARELERRHPQPPLFDAQQRGLSLAVEAWAERDLFWPIARYVSGINAEKVAADLHVDRAALRGKHTPSFKRLKSVAEMSYGLVETQLSRVENMLRDGRPYLLSKTPGLADLAVYHGLWFLSAMPIDCSAALECRAATKLWMDRVGAIEHGSNEEMSPREAIEVARESTPATTRSSRPTKFDPALGTRVAIRPEESKPTKWKETLFLSTMTNLLYIATIPRSAASSFTFRGLATP